MTNRFESLSTDRSPKPLSTDDNRVRRLLEMHRRLKGLQAKRFHLRNELKAVEKYLISLDIDLSKKKQSERFGTLLDQKRIKLPKKIKSHTCYLLQQWESMYLP